MTAVTGSEQSSVASSCKQVLRMTVITGSEQSSVASSRKPVLRMTVITGSEQSSVASSCKRDKEISQISPTAKKLDRLSDH
jgi:hypothetical protein